MPTPTMKRFSRGITIGLLTATIGAGAVWISKRLEIDIVRPDAVASPSPARFQLLFASEYDQHSTFAFRVSDEPPNCARDVDGGCAETGSLHVRRETCPRRQAEELFDSNLTRGEIVENLPVFGANGNEIGRRAMVIYGRSSRIVWTKRDEFWIIQANTLSVAGDFERSDEFKKIISGNGSKIMRSN